MSTEYMASSRTPSVTPFARSLNELQDGQDQQDKSETKLRIGLILFILSIAIKTMGHRAPSAAMIYWNSE